MKKQYIQPSMKVHVVKTSTMICGSGCDSEKVAAGESFSSSGDIHGESKSNNLWGSCDDE